MGWWAGLVGLAGAGFLLAAVNIESAGNLLLVSERQWHDPIKMYAGPSMDSGFYGFVQQEGDGLWAGWETFKRPPDGQSVSTGYGAYPLRLWGSNVLIERSGVLVIPQVVTERIYLQAPSRETGKGIQVNYSDLGTYLTRWDGGVVLVHDGHMAAQWR